jgi:hypothetical protein
MVDNTKHDEDAFDARLLKDFSVGSLVSWPAGSAHRRVGHDPADELPWAQKQYGVIEQIFSEKRFDERAFTFAKVIKTNGTTENFMLSVLTLESKLEKK